VSTETGWRKKGGRRALGSRKGRSLGENRARLPKGATVGETGLKASPRYGSCPPPEEGAILSPEILPSKKISPSCSLGRMRLFPLSLLPVLEGISGKEGVSVSQKKKKKGIQCPPGGRAVRDSLTSIPHGKTATFWGRT